MALFHHKTTLMQSVYFPLPSSSMSPFHQKGSQRSNNVPHSSPRRGGGWVGLVCRPSARIRSAWRHRFGRILVCARAYKGCHKGWVRNLVNSAGLTPIFRRRRRSKRGIFPAWLPGRENPSTGTGKGPLKGREGGRKRRNKGSRVGGMSN